MPLLFAGAFALLTMIPTAEADDSTANPNPVPEAAPAGDPLAEFLNLAERSAGPAEPPSADPAEGPAAGFSGLVSEACHYALECAGAIEGDRDAASRAFLMVAERLADEGSYEDALAVMGKIPDYRSLVAAGDLVLKASLVPEGAGDGAEDGEPRDWDAVLESRLRNHSHSLTFREEGEVLLREVQWAARQGKFDRVEEGFSRLRGYATLEYLARAEARVGIERARAGLDYDFDTLVSPETLDPLMGRALPDFMAHIGRAQLEIALIEYDRATDEGGKEMAREQVRAALATALASRVFIGDLLVEACAELTRRGEATFAKAVFLERAPEIGDLSNSVSVKPLLLARLAPLYREWAEEFDPGKLLDAAEEMASKQHAVNRARSLASIGGAWKALGDSDRALALWEESLALTGAIPGDAARLGNLAWLAVEVSWHQRELPETLRDSFEALRPKG